MDFSDEDAGDDPELRRRIENNDPSLDKLAISTFRYDDFGQQTYLPATDDDWKRDGVAVGKNTHIKRIKFKLPSWLEKDAFRIFCEGMADNTSIQRMEINYYSDFGGDIFDLLKPFFLNNITLHELRLDGCFGYSKEAVQYLCEALESFSSLQEFSFSLGNRLDRAGTEAIVRSLSGHSNLTTMNLKSSKLKGGGIAALVSILQKPTCALVDLDLGGFTESAIDEAGAIELATGLGANSSLKTLDLACNEDISAKGWGAIFAQFQSPRSSIETVRLTGSSLDDATANALARVLMNGTKLKSLELSNNRTITTEGWKAIFRAIPHCNQLEDLNLGCQVRQAHRFLVVTLPFSPNFCCDTPPARQYYGSQRVH